MRTMNRDPRTTDNGQRIRRSGAFGIRSFRPLALGLLCAVLTLSACGYNFVGGGRLPAGVEHIFLTLFENRTSEAGVENQLAQQLANQFTTRGRKNTLVGSAAAADAVMKGRIKSVNISTIARRTETESSERRVVIRVGARLESPEGRILWRADDIAATATFQVTGGSGNTGPGSRRALNEAAGLAAENLFNRLTADF